MAEVKYRPAHLHKRNDPSGDHYPVPGIRRCISRWNFVLQSSFYMRGRMLNNSSLSNRETGRERNFGLSIDLCRSGTVTLLWPLYSHDEEDIRPPSFPPMAHSVWNLVRISFPIWFPPNFSPWKTRSRTGIFTRIFSWLMGQLRKLSKVTRRADHSPKFGDKIAEKTSLQVLRARQV